ncbi:MAG: prephenate dehydratase [Chloroflexota bacterium]|nr:prephenate dehydratase [Chloroflexota bacterium]MDE2886289.1 prephenate dehydratase [Chloroflexota bacterium]
MKIAYLGPQGTFSEQAALEYAHDAELVAYRSITASATSVLQGEADEAVCPIENSYQGAVTDTLDVLLHEEGLHIRQELTLDIVHNLMVNPGVVLAAVKRVYSHPQALGQCRRYLEQHLPNAELAASLSTAEAVEQAMASDVPAAAIAPSRSAELYGAQILAPGIQDDDNNVTRFVVLGRSDHPRTGNDLTSVAMAFSQDRPGQLFGVLKEFAERNINLTKIESRPTRLGLGKYYFLMDIEGHRDDPLLEEVLTNVGRKASLLKVFGSYPRMTITPYLAALVRETAALRGYRSREQVVRAGTEVDVLLQAGGAETGVEIRATSSIADVRATAESFREAGLTQAIFVFADPQVAEQARAAAVEWPEELAATAVFTTAEHIGELL